MKKFPVTDTKVTWPIESIFPIETCKKTLRKQYGMSSSFQLENWQKIVTEVLFECGHNRFSYE